MKKVCLFDLNGTLVDTAKLDAFFTYTFGRKEFRQLWLANSLHASLVQSMTDTYYEFADIAEATVLEMAKENGIDLTLDQLDEFEVELNSLPVFPDVEAALMKLKAAGYTLAVLSNSSQAAAEDLLSVDDLLPLFDHVFSTDAVRRFKPAVEPYHMAADELGVLPHRIWMVAAHAWDTTGAARAGLNSALITRHGHGLTPFDRQPTIQGSELLDLVGAIIQKDQTILKQVSDWI